MIWIEMFSSEPNKLEFKHVGQTVKVLNLYKFVYNFF